MPRKFTSLDAFLDQMAKDNARFKRVNEINAQVDVMLKKYMTMVMQNVQQLEIPAEEWDTLAALLDERRRLLEVDMEHARDFQGLMYYNTRLIRGGANDE